MIGRTGIVSLDHESEAFKAACVKLVRTSMLRRLACDLAIDMGLDFPHESIIHVACELSRWVIWSIDSDGRPVMNTIGIDNLDDFARTVIRCEAKGLLEPDHT